MQRQKGDKTVPKYVNLMKLTDQGIQNIRDLPQRLAASEKAMAAMGGKLLAFYLVMGEWDYVAISEGPSDEVALAFLLGLGAQGNVRTTTLKAFDMEAVAEILKQVP
jgi:uncharacterized protein with GYD domain